MEQNILEMNTFINCVTFIKLGAIPLYKPLGPSVFKIFLAKAIGPTAASLEAEICKIL